MSKLTNAQLAKLIDMEEYKVARIKSYKKYDEDGNIQLSYDRNSFEEDFVNTTELERAKQQLARITAELERMGVKVHE